MHDDRASTPTVVRQGSKSRQTSPAHSRCSSRGVRRTWLRRDPPLGHRRPDWDEGGELLLPLPVQGGPDRGGPEAGGRSHVRRSSSCGGAASLERLGRRTATGCHHGTYVGLARDAEAIPRRTCASSVRCQPKSVRSTTREIRSPTVGSGRNCSARLLGTTRIRDDLNLLQVRLLILGAINWAVEWPRPLRQNPKETAEILIAMVFDGMVPRK